jgi:hypothetical protein
MRQMSSAYFLAPGSVLDAVLIHSELPMSEGCSLRDSKGGRHEVWGVGYWLSSL